MGQYMREGQYLSWHGAIHERGVIFELAWGDTFERGMFDLAWGNTCERGNLCVCVCVVDVEAHGRATDSKSRIGICVI